MRKLVIILLFTLTSCTITGPYTGTEYSIGANRKDGFYIKAMPLRWKEMVATKEAFIEWVTPHGETVEKSTGGHQGTGPIK